MQIFIIFGTLRFDKISVQTHIVHVCLKNITHINLHDKYLEIIIVKNMTKTSISRLN